MNTTYIHYMYMHLNNKFSEDFLNICNLNCNFFIFINLFFVLYSTTLIIIILCFILTVIGYFSIA